MNIRMGVPLVAEDGDAGTVERVILHPETREVEALVVLQGGRLARDVVVPVDWIVAADGDVVRVRGTIDEVSSLEQFAQSQYTAPPEDWIPATDVEPAAGFYLFPRSPYLVGAFETPATQPEAPEHEVEDLLPGDVEVSGSTDVYCRGEVVATVDRVVTEGSTDAVTHLVVLRGVLNVRPVAVPVSAIERMDDRGVHLSITAAELDRLPTFDAAA